MATAAELEAKIKLMVDWNGLRNLWARQARVEL